MVGEDLTHALHVFVHHAFLRLARLQILIDQQRCAQHQRFHRRASSLITHNLNKFLKRNQTGARSATIVHLESRVQNSLTLLYRLELRSAGPGRALEGAAAGSGALDGGATRQLAQRLGRHGTREVSGRRRRSQT